MFEHFADYMYYLLTAAFKRVKKKINAWYILFKVLGAMFDDAKEALFRAREEGMVATCSHGMLPVHGNDRSLTRYSGEDYENFRARIALYEETCRNGGTNGGIILAVKSLGYTEVEIKSVKEFYHDSERWAEFIVFITMNVDEEHPISRDVLRKTVRKWKEVGAKDNYFMAYTTSITMTTTFQFGTVDYKSIIPYFNYSMLNGAQNLDGSRKLDVARNEYNVRENYNLAVQNIHGGYQVLIYEKHNLHFLDGSYRMDGGEALDAYERTEVV